jgi:hypothetical protein
MSPKSSDGVKKTLGNLSRVVFDAKITGPEMRAWRYSLWSWLDLFRLDATENPLACVRQARGHGVVIDGMSLSEGLTDFGENPGVLVNPRDQFVAIFIGDFVGYLASARVSVSTAPIFEAQFSDVGRTSPIKDRLANREDRILFPQSPQNMHGDIALREEGVDQESVARVDRFLIL